MTENRRPQEEFAAHDPLRRMNEMADEEIKQQEALLAKMQPEQREARERILNQATFSNLESMAGGNTPHWLILPDKPVTFPESPTNLSE